MYADQNPPRDHEIKVRLDEDSYRLVKALAEYNKRHPAVLARELLIEGIKRLLNNAQAAEKDAAQA